MSYELVPVGSLVIERCPECGGTGEVDIDIVLDVIPGEGVSSDAFSAPCSSCGGSGWPFRPGDTFSFPIPVEVVLDALWEAMNDEQ